MKSLIDNWKNPILCKEQLDLNLREISHHVRYPEHWIDFIQLINTFKPTSILDIGCGCGVYYKLCVTHFPNINYTGIDYAEEAISLAKETWKYDNFFTMDYKDLTQEGVESFDLLHMGALLDVLPNGDEALEDIMSLKPKAILIGRMKLTKGNSYCKVYKAYDKIETYAFYHNEQNFLDLCSKNNYSIHHNKAAFNLQPYGNNLCLKKELSI